MWLTNVTILIRPLFFFPEVISLFTFTHKKAISPFCPGVTASADYMSVVVLMALPTHACFSSERNLTILVTCAITLKCALFVVYGLWISICLPISKIISVYWDRFQTSLNSSLDKFMKWLCKSNRNNALFFAYLTLILKLLCVNLENVVS